MSGNDRSPQEESSTQAISADEARWLSPRLERSERLARLLPDWDGYGTEPPNAIALERARKVLKIISTYRLPWPDVTPSAEEGICISFHAGQLYAHIECFNSGEIVAATSDGKGEHTITELCGDGDVLDERAVLQAAKAIKSHLAQN
jgi:hypothetical protein